MDLPDSLRSEDPTQRLVVALDVGDESQALRLADSLRPELAWVKVGLQLFTACGPDIVRRLVSLGLKVFLDLKLHDIPNTVAGAVESLGQLGVSLTTVHAGNGPAALKAAREAALAVGPAGPSTRRPGILAVTVLTSLGEDEPREIYGTALRSDQLVLRLGRQAIDSGADGLVASPREVSALRAELGPAPLLVIPGIRPSGSEAGDQSRVATPRTAIADGADLLVIGRPITRDPHPREALRRILDEISSAE